MGVKLYDDRSFICNGSRVSVPLRGNGCETSRPTDCALGGTSSPTVSVPLRGNGCETSVKEAFESTEHIVSVPLRGNGCETLIL